MKPKLMALAVATIGFAVGATATEAGASQAAFTANDYPALLEGTQEGASNFFEFTPGRRLECNTATYEAILTASSTDITLTPHYAGCNADGIGATVHLNGCHYTLEAQTKTSSEDSHGQMSIICPIGKRIEVTAATCKVDILPQGLLSGLTLTSKSEDITVDVTITNQIEYTDTDGFLCPFEGTATYENGGFFTDLILEGYEYAGWEPHSTTSNVVTYLHGDSTKVDVG